MESMKKALCWNDLCMGKGTETRLCNINSLPAILKAFSIDNVKKLEVTCLSYKIFYVGFLVTLIIIGIIQFFQFPKYLDYILLIIAIILGTTYIIKKFKEKQ